MSGPPTASGLAEPEATSRSEFDVAEGARTASAIIGRGSH